MPTFGDIVIEIVWTIISSIISLFLKLALLIGQLLDIVLINSGSLGSVQVIIMIFVIALVLIGVFKLLKGSLKNLVIAFVIFALLLLFSIYAL